MSASATFVTDGEDVAVAEGDYLLVSPESTRQVIGSSDGVRLLVIGAKDQAGV
jgi:quercetin dioxygenase-like cupin family protein